MIEPLDRDNSQHHRTQYMIDKINELVEVVNKNYDPQAEEALKQVAILEQRFDNHFHETLDTHYNTTSPKETA